MTGRERDPRTPLTHLLNYLLTYLLTRSLTYSLTHPPTHSLTHSLTFLTYLHTYLLIPWSRVLEKLTGSQLVKNFPSFYGTRSFITVFYKCPPPVHILSQINPVHTSPQPTSWKFIFILTSHLLWGLPSSLFASGFRTKTPLLSPKRVTCPANPILLDLRSTDPRNLLSQPYVWLTC